MSETLVISNEIDAFNVLELIKEKSDDFFNDAQVSFQNWPQLTMRLRGDGFHGTISPTVMSGFIDFQKSIYRAYALAKYNSVNINKLTKEEKRELEFFVSVEESCSLFGVDFQAALEKLMENAGSKLSRKDVLGIALVLGIGFFGESAYSTYMEDRKHERELAAKTEEQRAMYENMRFASEEETKRMQLLYNLGKQNAQISNIQEYSYQAKTALVKASRAADSVELASVEFDGEVADDLVKNARKTALNVRLDGRYRILNVDSSNVDVFKVKVRDLDSRDEFIAIVQDETLESRYKNLIKDAEWSKKAISLAINAKELGGEIRQATIIQAEEISEEPESDQ